MGKKAREAKRLQIPPAKSVIRKEQDINLHGCVQQASRNGTEVGDLGGSACAAHLYLQRMGERKAERRGAFGQTPECRPSGNAARNTGQAPQTISVRVRH